MINRLRVIKDEGLKKVYGTKRLKVDSEFSLISTRETHNMSHSLRGKCWKERTIRWQETATKARTSNVSTMYVLLSAELASTVTNESVRQL
jgi:hypothetical protein